MKNEKNHPSLLTFFQDHFHLTSLLKPMIYALIFAAVYNVGYLMISQLNGADALKQLVSLLWLTLYGLSLYFVCTLVWGRKGGTLSLMKVSLALTWLLGWNLLVSYVLGPLYQWSVSVTIHPILLLVVQLLGAFVLICMIPATLLYFKGLYENVTDIKLLLSSVLDSMKAHTSPIYNSWLILFLIMVLWDTLFSGPLSIYFGFNAITLAMQLLYLGNPLAFAMVLMSVMGEGVGGAYIYAVVLNLFFGLLMTFLEINLVAYIGSKWEYPQEKPFQLNNRMRH